MTGEFITKRPHKKSRAGCTNCKARKIKCDEKHPKCSFCNLRRLDCVYISRPKKSETTVSSNASSPSDVRSLVLSRRSGSTSSSSDDDASEILCSLMPAVHTSSGELTAFDLRLMHHYSVSTWSSLAVGNVPDTNGVLQVRVPQLAFENDFLMDAILEMASLHLQTTSPESNGIRHQTDVYRGKAFSGFRKALDNITPENYDATLIMSLLLVVLVSKDYNTNEDDLHVSYWLNLYRGLRTVIMLKGRFTNIQNTSVGPVFRRNLTELSTMPVVPQILLDMLSAVEPHDPDYPLLKIYCDALDSLGMLFASLQSDGIGAPLSIRVVSWPSWLKEEFVTAADEKRPRALVILSYYLAFTKLVTTLWWVDGIPDRDINVILRIVEPKWLPFLQIPFQVTLMTDPEEVAKLLLRC